MLLNLNERNIIRRYLASGMTPDAIANSLGRLSDLDDADILLIRAAAADMNPAQDHPRLRGDQVGV